MRLKDAKMLNEEEGIVNEEFKKLQEDFIDYLGLSEEEEEEEK